MGLGDDPVSLDYYMCKHVLYPLHPAQPLFDPDYDIPHNNTRLTLDGCQSQGIGTTNPADITALEYDFNSVGGEQTDDPTLPAGFCLYQNHPNPFSTETRIAFVVPCQTHITIEVYDLMGRRVAALVDEQIQAGQHQVIWTGRDDRNRQVGSGVYFYQLRADRYTTRRKMVLATSLSDTSQSYMKCGK